MDNENFYFENTEGVHSKFWAISIIKDKENKIDCWWLIRKWGKIGDSGRIMRERIYSNYEVLRKKDKLIEEKKAKGYSPVL